MIFQTWISKEKTKDKGLKAKLLKIYFGESHIVYYNFCYQYINHFYTIKVIEPNRILFIAFFFWDQSNFY